MGGGAEPGGESGDAEQATMPSNRRDALFDRTAASSRRVNRALGRSHDHDCAGSNMFTRTAQRGLQYRERS